jgi:hypothetical protein
VPAGTDSRPGIEDNTHVPSTRVRAVCLVRQNAIRFIHTSAALAVFISLLPVNGELPDQAAGVRTAFELIGKRAGDQTFSVNGLKSVSRS